MAGRKIDDNELLRLISTGMEQQAIAQHFGVSAAAISKRLKHLRQMEARPAVLDKLTPKEQRFVIEVASGKSQTQAAIAAFNVGTMDSAKTIGSRLARDPDIQEAITAVMESEGLDRTHLVRRLKTHVDNDRDPNVSLRAVDMGLKLHDAYPASKSMNMNINADVDPVDLSLFRRR